MAIRQQPRFFVFLEVFSLRNLKFLTFTATEY